MHKSMNHPPSFTQSVMKNFVSVLLFFLGASGLTAQTSVPKYVLIEHFTNSKCSICASKNPAFYNLIQQPQYAPNIHHISIHPPYPYNTCEFYLDNTTENSAWAALYGVSGTPRVALNGKLMPSTSQLLRQDTLQNYLGLTSPVAVQVTEDISGFTRTATVRIHTLGAVPAGNYKLFVALAEKTINKTTPNGESVHHDVFRKMLTPVSGQAIDLPAQGQSAVFAFNYTIDDPAWNADQIYALAFVKDDASHQVLNSGTKFDIQSTAVQAIPTYRLELSPNPAGETTYAAISDDEVQHAEIWSVDGRQVMLDIENQGGTIKFNTASLPPGVYSIKITGKKGIYAGKMVR